MTFDLVIKKGTESTARIWVNPCVSLSGKKKNSTDGSHFSGETGFAI